MIRLMITSECNNQCEYCFLTTNPNYGKFKTKLDRNKLEQRLRELKDANLLNGMEVIGGEPFSSPDDLRWLFDLNQTSLGNIPICIFTSGVNNVETVSNILASYKDAMPISVVLSYDGSMSRRNRDNFNIVQKSIWKIRSAGFSVNIRWSVTKSDIQYLFEHFKEFTDIHVDGFMFFPMKNADYTQEEIDLFVDQFLQMLQHANSLQYNFMGFNNDDKKRSYIQKPMFSCEDQLTILPDGRLCNCYVSLASSGFDSKMIFDQLSGMPTVCGGEKFPLPPRCKTCPLVFDGCNKCYGNLLEYQRLTGQAFFDSYCDLMQRLSEVYINFFLTEVAPDGNIQIAQGDNFMIYQNINGSVLRFVPTN